MIFCERGCHIQTNDDLFVPVASFWYEKMSFILPLPLNFASCEIQDGGQKNVKMTPMGQNL